MPIPDPTPDEPEPIREPEPEIIDDPIPPDVEILIGTPEPPPPSGPLLAGVGDVTNPTLIDESKVEDDELPPDFVTFQVDAYNGQVRRYEKTL